VRGGEGLILMGWWGLGAGGCAAGGVGALEDGRGREREGDGGDGFVLVVGFVDSCLLRTYVLALIASIEYQDIGGSVSVSGLWNHPF